MGADYVGPPTSVYPTEAVTHQKRFLLNRFRRCFEPVHWFWTGSCTNDTADLTPSAVHAVISFLNRFKRCVSRKSELWTGSRVWTGSNGEIPARPTLDVTIMCQTMDNAFATHYEPAHGFEPDQTPPKQTLCICMFALCLQLLVHALSNSVWVNIKTRCACWG